MLELNRLGLFPGPKEEEKAFEKRVLLSLSKKGNEEIPSIEKYGICPSWIFINYSNKGLLPWEGGCTWIFEENGVINTTLQLRRLFKHKKKYLKLYDKQEILIHELVHIGRIAFDEPKFEEFLAYRTSPNAFRREFSNMIEHSYEPLLFLIPLFLINLFLPIYFNLLPLTLLIGAFFRSKKRKKTFEEAKKRLKPLFKEDSEPFLYRLTDDEIIFCAEHTLEQILEKFSENSFRYRFLRSCYPYLN